MSIAYFAYEEEMLLVVLLVEIIFSGKGNEKNVPLFLFYYNSSSVSCV